MYQQMIREALALLGLIGVNPRHVEAYMRLEYGTLDHLSASRFAEEVALAAECVNAATTSDSERLAETYGLGEKEMEPA